VFEGCFEPEGIYCVLFSAKKLRSQTVKPCITDKFKARIGEINFLEIKAIKFSLSITDELLTN